jgi:plasmid stability protein
VPDEVENLMYQMRVRMRAARAGADSISAENGQILIQAASEEDERPDLGSDVRRSRKGFWLARREVWRERLLEVLRALAEG